jgi:hypothetical protein
MKYIVDRMEFNDQYNAYAARMGVIKRKPLNREAKWEEYQRNGTIEKQYLGTGTMLDMVEKMNKAASFLKKWGMTRKRLNWEKSPRSAKRRSRPIRTGATKNGFTTG